MGNQGKDGGKFKDLYWNSRLANRPFARFTSFYYHYQNPSGFCFLMRKNSDFIDFKSFLFIVVIVIPILVKLHFDKLQFIVTRKISDKDKITFKTLFIWSGGPRSSGVSFFCFVSPRA